MNMCAISSCERPATTRGWCTLHYARADDLIAAQEGLCAICQRPPRGRGHEARLHRDHDHETGETRAMLCGPCNKAIGLLNDDPDLVCAAASYLFRHSVQKEAS